MKTREEKRTPRTSFATIVTRESATVKVECSSRSNRRYTMTGLTIDAPLQRPDDAVALPTNASQASEKFHGTSVHARSRIPNKLNPLSEASFLGSESIF